MLESRGIVVPLTSTDVHRSIMDSGAPLTRRDPELLLRTRTDIILRSRENSKVRRRGLMRSKCSLTALARAEGDKDFNEKTTSSLRQPIFSARTLSAASVGSPTLVYKSLS